MKTPALRSIAHMDALHHHVLAPRTDSLKPPTLRWSLGFIVHEAFERLFVAYPARDKGL